MPRVYRNYILTIFFITGIATAVAGIKQISSPFLCCIKGNTDKFNMSISLGQMRKGDEILLGGKLQ